MTLRSTAATVRSARSPTWWPWLSLMLLEVVEIHHEQRHFRLQALGARQLARQVHEHEARVRQAGERIGERIFLRLLEDDRVVDDGRRLLRHAVEQPAVIVGVEVRRCA